jgi:hypothetical protein
MRVLRCCYGMLYGMLWDAMLCYAMLCYAMLCYAVLCMGHAAHAHARPLRCSLPLRGARCAAVRGCRARVLGGAKASRRVPLASGAFPALTGLGFRCAWPRLAPLPSRRCIGPSVVSCHRSPPRSCRPTARCCLQARALQFVLRGIRADARVPRLAHEPAPHCAAARE